MDVGGLAVQGEVTVNAHDESFANGQKVLFLQ